MKSIVPILAVLAFPAALLPLPARGEVYQIDPAHSTIGFRVHQFFFTTSGRFREFSGNIEFDPQQSEHSSVSARIQVDSIDTGNKRRDDHLRSAEFFNVAKFPEIIFRSGSVKLTGRQTADIGGALTMHGFTKPIVLHVRMLSQPSAERSRWQGTAGPIDRRAFQLMFGRATEGMSGISREVSVRIEIEAVRSR